MKALVTGAAGFVGPYLLAELDSAGDTPIAVDYDSGPDLLDPVGWVDLVKREVPDVIYHLAGWSDVGQSWHHPHRTFAVNAQGTLSVLQAAADAGVQRVLLISSADVYGLVDSNDLPIVENMAPRPRSPYGVSKQAAENLGQQFVQGLGLDVVIARPFNHLGPGQRPQFAAPAFAAQIAQAEQTGGGEVAHGDLSACRDLTDVRDIVRAYRLLMNAGHAGEIYNICSGHAVSMEYVLNTLIGASTVRIETRLDPERLRPVELPMLKGSPAKLMAATRWKPRYSLGTTLSDILAQARDEAQRPSNTPPPASSNQNGTQ